ncbi:hypothetical protein B9T29_04720 [Acinetobacter sp. ANC 3903]|uniref:hypothetical protein n=1 Tax=Acinetobacter sp. ANC 3903 TaxID=1977883 RepID=UPI000A33BBF3|nr:hypothetical protein [Acinetobacter sp. ANC 3903]OTG62995.1 hypothetical protein B9T29_04720 [Acinetobacter sp. ANC 3903]
MKKTIFAGIVALVLAFVTSTMSYAMTSLDDQSLSDVTGQALFTLTKETDATQSLDFFKLGFQAELSLNANIKSLQLGCGGDNGADKCDIDISDLSFGCVTNASGTCITLPGVAGQPTGADFNNAESNQAGLKDFVLTNPFFQFAIKGGSNAATRQVVGIRLGADKAVGPMSIGSLASYSGYLTGKTNLNIAAQTNIAVTCQKGTTGCTDANASKFSTGFTIDKLIGADDVYTKADGFLGVNDEEILNLAIVKVRYRDLTIDTTAASSAADVKAAGTRLTQVKISNLGLGNTVDDVVSGLTVNQICATPLIGSGCDGITGPGVANTLMPLLEQGIQIYMKEQTLIGLGQAVPARGSLSKGDYSALLTNTLNAYKLPYNLNNVHQLDVDSSLFGIALTALDSIKYPGYEEAVGKGWSMYLQDAFTLNINDSLTNLMSNMVQNGKAAAGNITTLAPAYRNCFGSLKFC